MVESPIRVLHIASTLGLGGTEKVMQLFVSHLDRSRFLPAVYSPKEGERAALIREAGVDTFITDDLHRVLERFRPTIVHVHRAGWPQPTLLTPLKREGVPIVVETNVFGRLDSSHAAEVIDRTLFVSRFCLDRFHHTTGIKPDPNRYGFLYNPVDTDFFEKNSCTTRDFSAPVAVRISRPDPGKWSPLALNFLPQLVREIPDFRYHIIGGIPEAFKYVHDNNLDKHVVFHDPIISDAEVSGFLDNASVLAHANDTGESFGMVIAEAMACGLPVVTHPSQGLKDNAQLELVEHTVTGLVARTADEYANALKFLFTHPEDARRMGEAGREKAARLYRAQTVTHQLEGVYDELLTLKGLLK